MAEQSESIKKAVVTLRQLSEEEKIRLQCEARERYRMDWQSSMRTSREAGKKEGIAIGIEQEKVNTGREKERADQAELLTRLTERLLEDGRIEECKKAIKDSVYQRELLKEYGIEKIN